VTEEKRPVDHALDLFVYAPLGLALEARALFPKLIDRGRQQVNGQVSMAKVVGQFAVRQGQAEGRKQFSKMSGQAQEALAGFGLVPPPGTDQPSAGGTGAGTVERPEPPVEPKPGAPIADAPDGAAPTVTARRSPPARAVAPPPPPPPPPPPSAPAVTLAIPDYDSLAASQVIPRLAGLADDELEAVRAYESAKRGRKTILNRVAQLQVG
jgi:hypothetical protein